jgi:hypothetical protein
LVSIASLEEQVAVENICGERICWLGFVEKPGTESWMWSDGTPEKFTNWHLGEPNNYDGVDENRAMMNFNFFDFSMKARSRRAVHLVGVLASLGVLCGLCGLAFWSVMDPEEQSLLEAEMSADFSQELEVMRAQAREPALIAGGFSDRPAVSAVDQE